MVSGGGVTAMVVKLRNKIVRKAFWKTKAA
jgi:hypothetical protein